MADDPGGASTTARRGKGGARRGNRPGGGDPRRGGAHDAPKPGLPARLAAAKLLGAVVDAHTALDGLTDDAHGHPAYLALDPRDRALVRAILLSALRHRNTIEAVIAHRLDRPLPGGARSLQHHLHVALAQILLLDVPDSAAVDLGVEAVARDPRGARFRGLANAILRRVARERERVLEWMSRQVPRPPDWLETALVDAYGRERTAAVLSIHAVEAPLDLTPRHDPTEWAARLGGTELPTGTVRLSRPEGPVTMLPGFEEGAWWVQDAAASLPARLLGDVTGTRTLDLCAAPGGKTAQLCAAGGQVTAVELNANRARRLEANLARLSLDARIVIGDATKLSLDELGGEAFDAVLLDAPCSSTGTIRRHPDVAWTKTPEDVARLAALQARLLSAAAELVAPGGRLVFANCSLLPEEGEALTGAFAATHPEFVLEPVAAGELGDDAALREMIVRDGAAAGTLRTTPDMLRMGEPAASGLDGFHAARFRRRG